MNTIKERKELTTILFYDWDPITTWTSLDDIYKKINDESKFMKFWDRIENKSNIKSIRKFKADSLDNFILSLTNDLRNKLEDKKKRLKKELWKEMTLEYAKNFINKIS